MPCLSILAALILSLIIGVGGASAQRAVGGGAPLSDEELAAERGGLRLPTGMEVGFGASVRTFVDGALVLETRLVWTDLGAVQTRAAPHPPQGQSGQVTLSEGAAQLPGVALAGDGGSTVVLHELSAARISNIVVNTASNRDIRQEVQIDLAIPELTQFQQTAVQERANMRMMEAVGAALRDAVRP
ncbi:hypothetical protein [Phenylobacterium sp. 58.2.17]|uniref:hypothetical protein n=1 Tax=Phenylobacterium sp. 58.2.17 TaxID=2969306 RepID=UPI002264B303|nr:hypothetical protein [Phenylobacterium sp. 58.2.17]MCX7587901.1 hypothetical protein [Phenylobacterium sp. 58.2.17]